LHKHRDRRSNALINEHYEYLVLVAKEDCIAAAGTSDGTDLNFDDGLTHTSSSTTPLPAKARIAGDLFGDPPIISASFIS
jgi:hypothetical protein